MKGQKKKQSGITLIALVISIIVMLILAGVSLNMTVGENGIVTQAQNAKLAQELAQEKEEIEMMMADFNISGDSSKTALNAFLARQVDEGKITSFKSLPLNGKMQIIAEKNGHYYYCTEDGDYWTATTTESSVENAETGSGFTVVSEDNFKSSGSNGSYVLNNDASIVFYDPIEGEFDFDIRSGEITIYLTNNMILTNQNKGRSAINIEPNAILNLYIEEGAKIVVDSGFGVSGDSRDNTSTDPAFGGAGGFAGIRVPKTSAGSGTLNLYGAGTLIAYGGDAGNGGDGYGHPYGGGGGGGAGAGIGGNGGDGGDGAATKSTLITGENSYAVTNTGWDGGPGEDCGNVNINEEVTVYAYGGKGGYGGRGFNSTGGGGGGYPAAGIGGGGAGGGGGDHADGGGGFSGGATETAQYAIGINGIGGFWIIDDGDVYYGTGGGGYYTRGKGLSSEAGAGLSVNVKGYGRVGGQGGRWDASWTYAKGGDGGKAGAGGNIKYTDMSRIFSYNGNMLTGGTDKGTGYTYPTKMYEYNCSLNSDGTTTTTSPSSVELIAMKKKTLDKDTGAIVDMKDSSGNFVTIIPTKIFAQTGIIRETYSSIIRKDEIDKIKVGGTYTETQDSASTIATYRVSNNTPTGYTNGYMANQGIGSGAGYLESSNGEFKLLGE